VLREAHQLYLLVQPAALSDLGLSPDQRARLKEVTDRAGKQWLEWLDHLGKMPPAERDRRSLEQAWANEADVTAILTPAQQSRLRQLALQAEGPGAFPESEVVAEFVLTPEQRERIRAIEEEALFGRMRSSPSRGDTASSAVPNVKPMSERVLGTLTQDQVRRWKAMIGDPAKDPLSPFRLPQRPARDPKRSSR
jgi:hypothetical protein